MEKSLPDELAIAPTDLSSAVPDMQPVELPADESSGTTYYLIVGSNLGDRQIQLTLGRESLIARGGSLTGFSSIYETQPWGYDDQPWFLNQVLCLESNLDPMALLNVCKEIETQLGRLPGEKWHARHIDIDILLAGDLVYMDGTLEIPHPQMQERNFVLVPLMEIAPHLIHPVLGKTIEELYLDCRDLGEVFIFSADEQVDPL
jgi:2-amino-4-hydroxy-6-hydroxymethyldihydropteridine diphosphokinase